jgi:DNA-binding NtrC family response regulator
MPKAVLIVGDKSFVDEMILKVFINFNVAITMVHDYRQALKVAMNGNYTLIVIDHGFANGTGNQVLLGLRGKGNPTLVVIIKSIDGDCVENINESRYTKAYFVTQRSGSNYALSLIETLLPKDKKSAAEISKEAVVEGTTKNEQFKTNLC